MKETQPTGCVFPVSKCISKGLVCGVLLIPDLLSFYTVTFIPYYFTVIPCWFPNFCLTSCCLLCFYLQPCPTAQVDGDTTIVSTTTATKGSSPIQTLSALNVSPPPPPSIPPIVPPAIVPSPMCDQSLGGSIAVPPGQPYTSTPN